MHIRGSQTKKKKKTTHAKYFRYILAWGKLILRKKKIKIDMRYVL